MVHALLTALHLCLRLRTVSRFLYKDLLRASSVEEVIPLLTWYNCSLAFTFFSVVSVCLTNMSSLAQSTAFLSVTKLLPLFSRFSG